MTISRHHTGIPTSTLDPIQTRQLRRQLVFRIELGIVFVMMCFGLMLRMCAFEGTLVVSGSMTPTLVKGDYIFVDHRAALRSTWKRGDVVTFIAPKNWDSHGETLVKRIVGVPGDTLDINQGAVRLNGRALEEDYIRAATRDDDCIEIDLKPDEYFMLGDNRDNSDDSRFNGPVSTSDIRGRALCVLWPPLHTASLAAPEYSLGKPRH